MKVLLVSPPFEERWREPENRNAHYPLGLAYIHSYIESKGHHVTTLQLNSTTYEEGIARVASELESGGVDVVGLNMLTSNRIACYQIIEMLVERHSEIKIVVGGVHAINMHRQLLQKWPDLVVVMGEGEMTMENLLRAYETNGDLAGVRGIAYSKLGSYQNGKDSRAAGVNEKQNAGEKGGVDENGRLSKFYGIPLNAFASPELDGSIVVTKEESLIEDLDILPFPKHEIFFSEGRTQACMLTGRGCPYKCSFCVLDSVSRRRVRNRSVANVIAEIEYLIEKYPTLDAIWFHDDVFFINNRRAIEICDEIVRRNIKLNFVCSGRFRPFTKELLVALERAGFVMILFGLETGSAKLLKSSHKVIKQEHVKETIRLMKDTKIEPICFLIVGLPGENNETIRETIDFVKELQRIRYIRYSDIGVLTVYPGTEVYELAKQLSSIEDSYWLSDGPAPLFTAEHSEEKLYEYKNAILNEIAVDRLFSKKGFAAQVGMLPYVIRSIMIGTPQFRMSIAGAMLRSISPSMFQKIKKIRTSLVN